MDWSKLNRQQVGTYAEYLVKMEFTKHEGFNVFSAEVDDRGIDFVLRYEEPITKKFKHFDIQVKSIRQSSTSYVFIPKSKFRMNKQFLVALVIITSESQPDIYLIPAKAWEIETALFRDRPQYKNPEYGLNLSKKICPCLNLLDLKMA